MSVLENYPALVSAIGALTLLHIIQFLIVDATGILTKHTPGTTIEADHNNFLFRASRVFANTNETIAIFMLASSFCVLVSAPAVATGVAAWAYVVARILYAICYYANLKLMRSVIFGVSLVSLIALLSIGIYEWL